MTISRETTREELSRPTPRFRMGHVLDLRREAFQPDQLAEGWPTRAFVIRVDWAHNRWRYFLQFTDRRYAYAHEDELERLVMDDSNPFAFPPITDDEEAMALESCREFSPERFDADGRPISLED